MSSRWDAEAVSEPALGQIAQPLQALIIDADLAARQVLTDMLRRWNVQATGVAAPDAGLAECRKTHQDFIFMSGSGRDRDGTDLCLQLRDAGHGRRSHIALLTDLPGDGDLSRSVDDILPSRPTEGELQLRLRSGLSAIRLREALQDTSENLSDARDRLDAAHARMDQSRVAAARLQNSLIPPRQDRCGPFSIGAIHRAAGQVTGDLIGYCATSERRLALYSIDVSGRDVPTAITTSLVAGMLDPQGLGAPAICDPAEVADRLNSWFWEDAENAHYLTMTLAEIDADAGLVRYCQAGHPAPAVLRAEGDVEFLDAADLPIGVSDAPFYQTRTTRLAAGEAFLLTSDGLLRALDSDGGPAAQARLAELLQQCECDPQSQTESDTLRALWRAVIRAGGRAAVADDVSALLVTMPGI